MEEESKVIRMDLSDKVRFWKVFDYFFVTRPILYFPGWATLIAGYFAAFSGFNFLRDGVNHLIGVDSRLLIGLVAFGAAMGGSFILNQLADVETDRNNNKLFFFGEGLISVQTGFIESFLLIFVALFLGLKVHWMLTIAIALFILITGYLYNFAPFNYKNKPIAGLVMNMLMGWLAFIIGWLLIKPIGMAALVQSLPFLFFNTGLYFLTTLPDVRGDREAGKITFPVKYGFGKTVYFSFVAFLISLLISILLQNYFLIFVALLSLPFYALLIVKKDISRAILTVKYGITFFCLMISVLYPLFFLILFVIFFATRVYYKFRFDFQYPTFNGK